MAVKGEVTYELRADDSKLESDLEEAQKKVEQATEKEADKIEQTEEKTSKTVKKEKKMSRIITSSRMTRDVRTIRRQEKSGKKQSMRPVRR